MASVGPDSVRLERFSSADSAKFSLDIAPSRRGAPVVLPDDFLRIPKSVVDKWWLKDNVERNQVRSDSASSNRTGHESDSDDDIEPNSGSDSDEESTLNQKESLECARNVPLGHRYKVRLEKDTEGGLGITLKFIEKCGPVVRSLSSTCEDTVGNVNSGVAEKAGIQPGDVLVGVFGDGEVTSTLGSLGDVAAAIKSAPPKFHLLFDRPMNQHLLEAVALHSFREPIEPVPTDSLAIPIASLAALLHSQGLLNKNGAKALSSQLNMICKRSRQWQRHNKVIVDRNPPINSPSSGFLAGLLWGKTSSQKVIEREVVDDIFSVPISPSEAMGRYRALGMDGVRPALVIRILGLSKASDHTEYIVWVVDAASGDEWRVLRRFRDFQRLEEDIFKIRSALRSALALDFPVRRLSHIYESVPGATALERACKLSRWLRRLAALLPGCGDESVPPNRNSPLVALALQRFLEATPQDINRRLREKENHEDMSGTDVSRAVHVFAHRILSLPALEQSVSDFIAKLGEQYESRSASTLAFEVGESMLAPMGSFIDLLQECILKGCEKDIRSYVRRHTISCEKELTQGEELSCLIERSIVRGVRRAVECEVYVPLMGKVQRSLLGTGATNEDKFKAERRRVRAVASKLHGKRAEQSSEAQLALGIHASAVSPSGWSGVSRMLEDIDNRYALPCDRIAALVKAGRAIPSTFREEHPESDFVLGADDILPVFIYALTGSSTRDLTAVRRLLHTFADKRLREGEEGYYLTTLDAAVDHITNTPTT